MSRHRTKEIETLRFPRWRRGGKLGMVATCGGNCLHWYTGKIEAGVLTRIVRDKLDLAHRQHQVPGFPSVESAERRVVDQLANTALDLLPNSSRQSPVS